MLAAATTLPLMVVLLNADWAGSGFSSAEATETNALAIKTIAIISIAVARLLTNGVSEKIQANAIVLPAKKPAFSLS